ncbi:MAG: hypothetical protein HYX91_03370 [Chloroflexi bacterium]|nr:hypothetical protein [Chloroflexota bacterium]
MKRLLTFVLVLALLLTGLVSQPVFGSDIGDVEIKLEGAITKTDLGMDGTGFVKVSGVKVKITGETEVEGTLEPGVEVRVEGELKHGKIIADRIRVHDADEGEIDVTGAIKKIGLKVGDTFVFITGDTMVDGDLEIGETIGVSGMMHHGFLLADTVEVDEDTELEFKGEIEKIALFLPGVKVIITEDTGVAGDLEVGAEVDVEGMLKGTFMFHDKTFLKVKAETVDVK